LSSDKKDTKDVIERNTLVPEFLDEGMDARFSSLFNYNSLKYPMNSPRGKKVQELSTSPDLLRTNLTKKKGILSRS